MIQKITAILMVSVVATWSFGQNNKVTNGSFEELDSKVKYLGQFDNVTMWNVPEGCEDADLFTSSAKKEVTVPDNVKGRSETKDGENYAGILAYSEREKSPRTFIQTKLMKKLLPGKKYCIKMNVSLSDISKYSVNTVGMYLSSKAIKLKDIENYDIKPQLLPSNGVKIEETYDWVTMCNVFKAEGTERYVTIGNFAPQSSITPGKMKRSREYTQPQTRDAYYFVDDVSIIPLALLSEGCDCQIKKDDGPQLNIVYTKNVSEGHEGTDAEKIELKILHYNYNVSNLDEDHKADLEAISALMSANPEYKIEVNGHTDNAENPAVADERARKVYAYLTSLLGINANRINYSGKGGDEPTSENATAEGRAQNRRVVFRVL